MVGPPVAAHLAVSVCGEIEVGVVDLHVVGRVEGCHTELHHAAVAGLKIGVRTCEDERLAVTICIGAGGAGLVGRADGREGVDGIGCIRVLGEIGSIA